MRSYLIAFFVAMGVLLLAYAIHVVFLAFTPWEWDEPVYTNIATQTLRHGYPAFQTLPDEVQPEFYPYHPPFHFHVLANVYRVAGDPSILVGRVWSSFVATLVVGMGMLITLQITYQPKVALLAGVLLAIDGWFAYTSLLVKLDTSATLLGLIGLACWIRARRTDAVAWSILAGMFIGMAAIYKHVAIVFAVGIAIHWLLTRRDSALHIWALGAVALIGVLYLIGMAVFVGEPFLNATAVQIRRALGLQIGRGLNNYGLTEVVQALTNTYWAYLGTLFYSGVGVLVSMWRLWESWRGRDHALSPVAGVVLAAVMVLGFVKLRNPHYLVYLIAPAVIMATVHIWLWWRSRKSWLRRLAVGVIVVVVFLHGASFTIRAVSFSQSNALAEVQRVFATQVDRDAVVVAEEPVCAMIAQPCYKIGVYNTAQRLAEIQPDIIVVYSSLTQDPPDSPALLDLMASGDPRFTTQGWKERITIIVLD